MAAPRDPNASLFGATTARPEGGGFLGGFGSNTGDAASLGANQVDFFGDSGGSQLDSLSGKAPAARAVDPTAANVFANRNAATNTANINAKQDRTSGTGAPLQSDVMGGATGAYNAGSDASRANYDYMHDLGHAPGSVGDFFNQMGEKVGVSHAGDAAGLTGGLKVTNPFDFNPLSTVTDPNKGIGTNAGNAGKPLAASNDALAAIGSTGILPAAGQTIGGAVSNALGGDSGPSFDTSGADRGGSAYGGAGIIGRNQGVADQMRAKGSDVMSGSAAPGGAGTGAQQDALDKAMGFLNGPRAQNDVMGKVDAFSANPEGASAAENLLNKGQQGAMADVLSAARSGRARDAGSQARAMNVAQGELGGMGIDAARDASTLRAQESQQGKQNQLNALGLEGQLAGGLDSNTLQALGLGGDLATQMRSGNITERGQTLGYDQGMNQIGAGVDSDILKTIPGLEGVRHSDEFDLTPQQKLEQAKLAGGPSKTTADYVTGLLGDVLSAI